MSNLYCGTFCSVQELWACFLACLKAEESELFLFVAPV